MTVQKVSCNINAVGTNDTDETNKRGETMKRARLRQERLERGMSYQDVANELGISSVYVRKIESGDRNPGFVTALRFGKKWIISILTKSSNMLANPSNK